MMWSKHHEIRLAIFAFRDLTIFSLDLLSDGNSIYTRENLYENLGTPVNTCSICLEIQVFEV